MGVWIWGAPSLVIPGEEGVLSRSRITGVLNSATGHWVLIHPWADPNGCLYQGWLASALEPCRIPRKQPSHMKAGGWGRLWNSRFPHEPSVKSVESASLYLSGFSVVPCTVVEKEVVGSSGKPGLICEGPGSGSAGWWPSASESKMVFSSWFQLLLLSLWRSRCCWATTPIIPDHLLRPGGGCSSTISGAQHVD